MIKAKAISATLSLLGIIMIIIAVVLQSDVSSKTKIMENKQEKVNVANMSSSNRVTETKVVEAQTTLDTTNVKVEEVSMEEAPQAEYIPPRIEVYAGMTMDELSAKLDRSLGDGYIAGKGRLIATKALELGVDPYVATAIMLHETGCKYNCSSLVVRCNNVGGQKGGPSCGGGSYKAYATIDEGIVGHIENLYNNYYSKGYNTVALIGPRYAESSTWQSKINWYIEQIGIS